MTIMLWILGSIAVLALLMAGWHFSSPQGNTRKERGRWVCNCVVYRTSGWCQHAAMKTQEEEELAALTQSQRLAG